MPVPIGLMHLRTNYQSLHGTNLEVILMGDFNIDYHYCNNSKWLQLMQTFDMSQLVNSPTRVTKDSSSSIDHIYTTNKEYVSHCFVPPYVVSDHYPVCLTR